MGSLNKTLLIGNLGSAPELKALPDGTPVCNLSIATTERWLDKKSEQSREHTEWHRVVLYRRLAEIATKYLSKGSKIYIEGKLRTRKWQDKDGNNRYTTEIEATEMQMLSSMGSLNTTPPATISSSGVNESICASSYDDIPF